MEPPPDPATEPPVFRQLGGVAAAGDVAKFLAGKPVRSGAALSAWQMTPEYRTHESELRAVWTAFTRYRVRRMERWSHENLSPALAGERVVYYPFGGPDLLHVHALFPHARRAILMGLEPVGDLPILEEAGNDQVFAALPAYRQATRTQLQVGYFITRDMRTDLDSGLLRGVTPVLLATISLKNGWVDQVTPFNVAGNQAVEVSWRDRHGQPRSTIYIRGDLSNSGFSTGYRDWLAAQGPGSSYFKAASYLMHDNRFSVARDYFLRESRSILQDDSGIPFRYLQPSEWLIRYYGNYEAPIGIFTRFDQPDLRAAYQANISPPLEFGSGYHYQPDTANLIHAMKRR